ncbi:5-formyltetrahydrofolate cyclo-ligase [Planctopirus limnophila DSM 3776]|uniref:5-formyltetrahydrofolate cyclo-ligase n=1 Tax=Planctopirus limnophila (strain ATCC 43296 / DSM 3776 / IFAM 1008 / Mu 290) TaxID=521674 RepID=D5SUM8_PLAL2|nr:5-formyltetrahydrofolate cyclo-ligase [Planctopirus limnophila]ADG67080.1 5-formyltetrahydrofolate cyclo-ligase [Planctopirus limnophila DSM 3776]
MSSENFQKSFITQKEELRQSVRSARLAMTDRSERSHRILDQLESSEPWKKCRVPLVYLSSGSEVMTWPLVEKVLKELEQTAGCTRKLIVPWCDGDELRLFWLQSLDELSAGSFGIPEPRAEMRTQPDRCANLAEIDLVVLPGLAFDEQGRRLGQGRGYFDRLLMELNPHAIKVGLAFEVQMVEEVPVEEHDLPVDLVITESRMIWSDVTPGS